MAISKPVNTDKWATTGEVYSIAVQIQSELILH